MITAIAVAPAIAVTPGAAAPLAANDSAIAACDAWLALQAEVGRLTSQWARRETWLVEHCRWFQLSEDERRALPEAQDLYRIDARLTSTKLVPKTRLVPPLALSLRKVRPERNGNLLTRTNRVLMPQNGERRSRGPGCGIVA